MLAICVVPLFVQQATAPAVPSFQQQLTQAESVAQPMRLEATPVFDGVISPDEWDPFYASATMQSYLQWAPQHVYFAAKLPAGADLVASFDFGGKGWLIGAEHLEARVSLEEGKPALKIRILDATNPAGPAWIPVQGFADAAQVAATSDSAGWTVEVGLEDPGLGILPDYKGGPVGARIDEVPSATVDAEPFWPRNLAPLKFETDRDSLPAGLHFQPESWGRDITPGNGTSMRLTWNGQSSSPVQSLEIHTLGPAQGSVSQVQMPFAKFDKKNRAFVDYRAQVGADAPIGFHIVRATLTFADGTTGTSEMSYEIAPLVSFDMPVEIGKSQDKDWNERITVYIQSHSSKRVDGQFSVVPPEGWPVVSGNMKSFVLFEPHARKRQVFEVHVPAGTHGAFPFKFQAQIGDHMVEQTLWKTIR